MKIFKLSSIMLLSVLFMWVCIPQAQAKHHSSRRLYTSFSLNLNLDPRPRHVEYNVIQQPSYTVVRPYYAEPVYYAPTPYYREVVVQRPYAERVYVYPSNPYWGY